MRESAGRREAGDKHWRAGDGRWGAGDEHWQAANAHDGRTTGKSCGAGPGDAHLAFTTAECGDPLPTFVAVRGVFLRTVGVIQVKPLVRCLLPRSAHPPSDSSCSRSSCHRRRRLVALSKVRFCVFVEIIDLLWLWLAAVGSGVLLCVLWLRWKTDGAFVHQTMDKWPSSNRYSLKAALMINYDPVGPSLCLP
ncbi:hypothetical protein Ahy_B06g081548 isoform A [Arachis hypogaea]|uniref:Uncharacterized protein n=1 Tax=Arachis hypogaea TaxID=3818 RepID=A0A444YLG6_ARAHY|nr:hypothetical protein Ahy_B06g081548 isoform A [Arachis hypogaea]